MTQPEQPEEKSIRISMKFEPFNTPGTSVTGIYKGHRTIPFNTDTGVLPQYLILTDDGAVLFNGTYQLNDILPGVPVGTRIQVTFIGETRLKNGFKAKEFEIKVVGPDVDRVLEEWKGFSLGPGESSGFLPPARITIDPLTGEILPEDDQAEENEDEFPF